MQRTLSFLRVFDLAFFAPGTTLMFLCGLLWGEPEHFKGGMGPVQITIVVLAFVATAYLSGLVVHSVVWLIKVRVLRLLGFLVWLPWELSGPLFQRLLHPLLLWGWKRLPGGLRRELTGLIASEDEWVPFPLRLEAEVHKDLILYFWYLRATCWNATFALAVGWALIAMNLGTLPVGLQPHSRWASSGLLVGAFALLSQGNDFHRTFYKSFDILAKETKAKGAPGAR